MSDTAIGLCGSCQFCQRIDSARGSSFHLCQRALTDPAYRKYPPLPVLRCAGYVALSRRAADD